MPEVKPKHCPLCGSRNISRGKKDYEYSKGAMHWVKCNDCGCEIRKLSARAAIKRWNVRYAKPREIKEKNSVATLKEMVELGKGEQDVEKHCNQ